MEKWMLMLAVCFLAACQPAKVSEDIVISGHIAPGEQVDLQCHEGGMIKTVATVVADSTGAYRLEYRPGEMRLFFVGLSVARQSVPVMVWPGEEIQLDMTGSDVIFSKDAADRNRFMQDLEKRRNDWQKAFPADLNDVVVYRQALEEQYEAFRNYMAQADCKDEEVKGVVEADALVQHYSGLLNFPMFHQLVTGNTVEVPEDYYLFLKEVELSSPYLNNLGNTNSFLYTLFATMEEHGFLTAGKNDYLLKQAECIKHPLVKEKYILYAADLEAGFGYNQYLGEQLIKVKPFVLSQEGRVILENVIMTYNESAAQNARFNAGQVAFDFTGTDATGKQHKLSDYKGKVVVVDVWNTGCKPCIAEIPYLRKLEERLKDRGVVFISYSLDTDTELWKSFMGKHRMEGHQWIDTEGFKSPLAKAYNVRFIPRFMVFDKAGAIVDVYAPRPSNPRLSVLIEDEVNR